MNHVAWTNDVQQVQMLVLMCATMLVATPIMAIGGVVMALQKEGIDWCSITDWRGRVAVRISVPSWAMSDDDVERSVETMVRIAGAAT